MSSQNHSRMMFDLMFEGKHDMPSQFIPTRNDSELPPMHNPWNSFCYSEQNDNKDKDITKHQPKRMKKDDDSTLEELKRIFKSVQMQHPESRLELQCVDGIWKVWCGACKKLLRTDKSGKALHNIQRQHFSTSLHKKKLHQMLQAEEGEAVRWRKYGNVKSEP